MRDKKLWVSFVPILFVFCGGGAPVTLSPTTKNFILKNLVSHGKDYDMMLGCPLLLSKWNHRK